jgi:hypothetical protein
LKWPTDWAPFNGDVRRVRDIEWRTNGEGSTYPPFAVLTPDGKWHEREEPVLRDAVDEEDLDKWRAMVERLLLPHQDDIAVVWPVEVRRGRRRALGERPLIGEIARNPA